MNGAKPLQPHLASRPSDSDSSSKSVGGSFAAAAALRGGSVLLPAPLLATAPALDAKENQKKNEAYIYG